jgi:hypothetical protein
MSISSVNGGTYVSPYVAPKPTTTPQPVAQSFVATKPVTVSISSSARVMLASATVAPTSYTAADAIAKYKAAVDGGTLAGLEQIKIQDTAANIQANLADLSALAKDKKLSGVVLTGTGPSLTIDRSLVTGDLASTASTNGTALLLQKISSPYVLKVDNATAADALSLKKPTTKATLSINVKDTAATVGTNLDKLQALVKSKAIARLTLTDAGTSPLKVSMAQITSAVDLLKAIQGSYKIAVSDLTAASALALKSPATNASLSLTIKDTAANISTNLDKLQALVKSGNITALTVTDGAASAIKLTSAQVTSASDLLSKLQGNYKLAVSGVKTADVTQTLTVKNVATIDVADTAANVQSNLTSLGDLAKSKKLSSVSLTSPTPSLTIDRTAVTGDLSSLTSANGTIQLLQRITTAYTLQVNNVTATDAQTLKSPSKTAKLSIGVKDTTANILANLEKLQPLASAKTISSITASDSSAPTLKVTAAQLTAASASIKAIQGNYQLQVTNVKAADVAKIGAQANVVSIEVVDTNNNIIAGIKSNLPETTVEKVKSAIVTDPLSITNAYKLLETVNFDNYDNVLKYTITDTASNIIARQRYDLGNVMKWATKVTLTDKTAPTLTVADAKTFTTITKLDPAIKFSISDGGKAIAEQAAIVGDKVLSSASSISINKSFSIADAKRVLALGNLDKSTKYSITDTVANILAASPTEKAILGATSVNVLDTSTNVVASLSQLQVLARNGKIATIKLQDESTKDLYLSRSEMRDNAEAIGKIVNSVKIHGVELELTSLGQLPSGIQLGDNFYLSYLDSTGNSFFDIFDSLSGNLLKSHVQIMPSDSGMGDGRAVLAKLNDQQFIVLSNAYSLLPDLGPTNTSSTNFRGHFFRVFNDDGTPAGDPVLMTPPGYANWSYGTDSSALVGDKYVISLGHFGNGSWSVFGDIKSINGTSIKSHLAVSQSGQAFSPKVSVAADQSKALMVWTKLNSTTGGSSVWGRFFDLNSMTFQTNEFRISEDNTASEGGIYGGYESDTYSLVATNTNSFQLNWTARLQNGTSVLRGREITLENATVSMSGVLQTSSFVNGNVGYSHSTKLSDGRIAVVYSGVAAGDDSTGVYLRLQDQAGKTLMVDQKISDTLSGFVQPKVSSVLDGNNILIVWDDYTGPPTAGESANLFSRIVRLN